MASTRMFAIDMIEIRGLKKILKLKNKLAVDESFEEIFAIFSSSLIHLKSQIILCYYIVIKYCPMM